MDFSPIIEWRLEVGEFLVSANCKRSSRSLLSLIATANLVFNQKVSFNGSALESTSKMYLLV